MTTDSSTPTPPVRSGRPADPVSGREPVVDQPSRRVFLGGSISRRSILALSPAAGVMALAACTSPQQTTPGELAPPGDVQVPYRPPLPPDSVPQTYHFLTPEEARTVEAVTARIIPGTDDDPGAVQAGVPFYIDAKLTQFEQHAEPTFTRGPYAQPYDGDAPPTTAEGFIAVRADQLYRYGFQSPLTPRQIYRLGVPALDDYSRSRFDGPFAELDEDQQDAILRVLDAVDQRSESEPQQAEGGTDGAAQQESQSDDAEGDLDDVISDEEMDAAEEVFGELGPGLFFSTVRQDTIEGFFSDPSYGGNRDMVGWTLIGYPGSQRSYSPEEMMNGTTKAPQPMHLLTAMNPDRAGAGRPAIEQHDQQHGG